jgi:SAM-dependent methyltransferase
MTVFSSRYTVEDQQRMAVAKNYFAWQNRVIAGELGTRVLEIGCGIGNITQTLLDRELVIALDSDSSCVAHLRHRLGQRANLHTMVCDICCDEFLSVGKFGADSCAAVNVLEHIEDDQRALARMAAVLRPGGVIVLIVPAFSFLFGPIDRNLGHCRRYSPRTIRDLAESVNICVRKIRFMNFVGFFGWWMNARVFKREAQSTYQIHIFDHWIVPVLSRIEDRVPPPLGQSLLAVLQVP